MTTGLRTHFPQLAAIAAVVAGAAGAFAYVAGWLSPGRLTPNRVVDQFERTNGLHPGFRRNHSKGLCFSGWFDSGGEGRRLSRAAVFRPGRTPVFGRFAIAGGQPFIPDTPSAVHSMAVDFELADGETWRTGMNGIPVFTVGSVRDLYDQLAAAAPDPRTGKPDPAALKAYFASHPQAARATAIVRAQPLASGFADTTYNSLDAFLFRNADGAATPVRWAMVAEDAFRAAQPGDAASGDATYQFDDLVARVRKGVVRWRFEAIVGQPGDPTADATVPWPPDRERVLLGTLTVDALQDEAHGRCRDVTFDPTVLPNGIEPSDDPILAARSSTYAVSLDRRAGEAKVPSAVRLPASVESPR